MTRIVGRRMAGEDHAVVTVAGCSNTFRRKVCDDCPWRKDAVGKFPAEAFRLSANSATDGANLTDAPSVESALHIFGCHQSGTEKPATCAGYILRGSDAIGWRIGVATGKFLPSMVDRAGVELHESYYEMAVANGVSENDPALDSCRPWRGKL